MAWSTRELADLAGTTVNTIRHYHRLGLLDVPERRYNGYKQYEVAHLVCLLRIRRLVDLGVPLSQVGAVSAAGATTPDALQQVDAELAERIAHLQRARSDIAAILRDNAPADVPAGFETVASRLSESDRSIIHIYKQLYDEDAIADVRKMVEADTDVVGKEIDLVSADTDDATRQRLAERLAPILAQNMLEYPWLTDPVARLSKSARVSQRTFVEAMVALYNPAQLDVLARADILAQEQLARADDEADDVR